MQINVADPFKISFLEILLPNLPKSIFTQIVNNAKRNANVNVSQIFDNIDYTHKVEKEFNKSCHQLDCRTDTFSPIMITSSYGHNYGSAFQHIITIFPPTQVVI